MNWKNVLNADPTEWLLEGEPWVRYNTLRVLLEKESHSSEVENTREKLVAHPLIKSLIAEVKEWPSYPLKRHNDAKHPLHKLAVLADFGITANDPEMRNIHEKVLQHQSQDGAFQIDMLIPPHFGGSGNPEKIWMACDAPTSLYALLKMGFKNKHVQTAIEHLTSLIRENGVLCTGENPTFRGPGRKSDPCPYATLLVTKALSQVPEMRKKTVSRGAEMLLWHWEHQEERRPYLFGIGTNFRKLKYPFVWYDILHVADVLSQIDFLKDDERLKEMVDTIVSKQDSDGRFTPESVWMAFKKWDFGQKKAPSAWITFLVARIVKRMYS